jgi:hypothetical protein
MDGDGRDWDNMSREVEAFCRDLRARRFAATPRRLEGAWLDAQKVVSRLIAACDDQEAIDADLSIRVSISSGAADTVELELKSDELLRPDQILQPAAVEALVELGWDLPSSRRFPTFSRSYDGDDPIEEAAEFVLTTLRDVYGVNPLSVRAAHPEPPNHLQKLMAVLPADIRAQVASNPLGFGMTPAVCTAALDLLEDVRSSIARIDDDGLVFNYAGDAVFLRQGKEPGDVLVTLQHGPASPLWHVLNALARLNTVGHERQILEEDDGLLLQLEAAVPADQRGAPQAWLESMYLHYWDIFYGDPDSSDAGAYPTMVEQFATCGLGAPHVPQSLKPALAHFDTWWWTTDDEEDTPSPDADYIMATAWLEGPVPDHLSVSHAGHGVNSYALTWRMAYGPVAMLVQAPYGGIYDNEAASVGAQAGLYRYASLLIQQIEQRNAEPPSEPRVRQLFVYASLLRGFRCSRFDELQGRWEEIEMPPISDDALLAQSEWWLRVSEIARDVM